ncbi:Methyltransferase-like protein 21D [Rhizoclosmatium sp. JEL0117]|nr:Methyltransferase-like protein 21D [Rhizoclosmatium sp. JEL0117]
MATTHTYTYELNDGTLLEVQQDADVLGATVWDSSLVLAKYLEKQLPSLVTKGFSGSGTRSTPNTHVGPVRILELGSGCGLLGLVASAIVNEATVVVSDVEKLRQILKLNTERAANVQVKTLEWRSEDQCKELGLSSPLPPDVEALLPVDVILLADCVYDESCFAPLNYTLKALCDKNPNTLVIMAYERRNFDKEVSFFKQFGEHFRFRHVMEDDLDPRFKAVDEIYLFLAKRRADKEDF